MTTHDHEPYRDPSRPVGERVDDLLGRMTLDEKLAQLGSVWIFQIADAAGLDADRATPLLADGIGHITRMGGASSLTAVQSAELANDVQRHLLDHTRLGIPALVHEEICSGLMAREATIYPQAIGVASTFRPDHNRHLADTIRRQMRAVGAHQGLSPVLDICRDPRWVGSRRPTAKIPISFSHGRRVHPRSPGRRSRRRGDRHRQTLRRLRGVGGRHELGAGPSARRELRDVYLRPFEAAVREGRSGVGRERLPRTRRGAVRLEPVAAHRGVARRVGVRRHGRLGLRRDQAAVRVPPRRRRSVGRRRPGDRRRPRRRVAEHRTRSVRRSPARSGAATSRWPTSTSPSGAPSKAKFRLGLFEQPFVDTGTVRLEARTDEQLALARQIAHDSLVLLKNDGVLPLARPASVAVIGPNADSARHLLGDYSYLAHVESLIEVLKSGRNVFAMPLDHGVGIEESDDLDRIETVAAALARHLPDSTVEYERGCDVNSHDRSGFDAAVALAARSDVAVLVLGERSGLTDDCTTGESRDVASLDLPGVQEDLVRAVAATGTPVVVVLVAGRPIGSPAIHDLADAVLLAWLPGETGADAVAAALVGDTSPGGHLPVSYPRSSGQVPVFYSHKVSGGRSHWKGEYVDLSNEPLYPFGHGLSYSTFEIVPDPIGPVEVDPDGEVAIGVTLRNTGDRTADEVVQLYSRDPVAPITRPVLELQDFARVTLDPGNSATIGFTVPVAAFGYTGVDMTHVVDPGVIELFVGRSSADVVHVGSVTVSGHESVERQRAVSRATVTLG
ncbi:MAG: glycoside hydrolase family 3 C-terminal domain-containing protein [Ilumatobacteraceae bacterium]